MPLKVNEISYSIQGESSYAGLPCVFVRLTGCNLRCSYCDTRYAYEEGEELEIDDILDRVSAYECPLVEITGGEPLLQLQTPALIERLLDEDFDVLLETNGSQDVSKIDERCVKIVDIKCPSSGEHSSSDLGVFNELNDHDEIKFVIGNRADYDYAKRVLEQIDYDPFGGNPVHFSPVFGKMKPDILAQWILEDHVEVRLHLQLHKYIWDPNKRKV